MYSAPLAARAGGAAGRRGADVQRGPAAWRAATTGAFAGAAPLPRGAGARGPAEPALPASDRDRRGAREYTPRPTGPECVRQRPIPEARAVVTLKLSQSDLGQFTLAGSTGVFTIGKSGGGHWYGGNGGSLAVGLEPGGAKAGKRARRMRRWPAIRRCSAGSRCDGSRSVYDGFALPRCRPPRDPERATANRRGARAKVDYGRCSGGAPPGHRHADRGGLLHPALQAGDGHCAEPAAVRAR